MSDIALLKDWTTRRWTSGGTLTGDLTVEGTLTADTLTYTPAGTISAATVAGALAELDTDKLAVTANLTDLADIPTARASLGLGGAAVLNVGATAGTVAAGDDVRFVSPDTPAQVLAKLVTVDGSGSTLDADLLDGLHATAFATPASVAAAVTVHEADTTGVHGIADTAALVLTGDARLTNARTPTAHAATHASGGTDVITVAESQVTGLVADLAARALTSDARFTDARTPTGAAGGVLAGTYPNPSFAADMATQAELDAHVIATGAHAATKVSFAPSGNIAATNVQTALVELDTEKADATATTAALAAHEADTTAIHGIADTAALVLTGDSRLTNARTPTVHAVTHASAGSDPVTLAESQVTGLVTDLAAKLAKASNLSDLANVPTARTSLGLGGAAVLSVGTIAGTVAAGDDSRLTNARTPTAHAATHATGGTDAITVAQAQVTGLVADLALKAPLASPTFTGTVNTAAVTATGQIAAGAGNYGLAIYNMANAFNVAQYVAVAGEAYPRWLMRANGLMEFSGGAAAADVNFSRSGVGALAVSADLAVNGKLIASGAPTAALGSITANPSVAALPFNTNAVNAQASLNSPTSEGVYCLRGLLAQAYKYGAGNLTSGGGLRGLDASVINWGAGAVTEAVGVMISAQNLGPGVVTSAFGISINSPYAPAAITNAYGVYISSQTTTGVTNAYGIYQAGASDLNRFFGPLAIGTNPAQSGVVRLANNAAIVARNAANTADARLAYLYSDDKWYINSEAYGIVIGGAITLNGQNLTAAHVNGLKIGTATTEKLAFWGATPIVRPTGTPAAATDPATTMALVNDLRTKLLATGLIG